MNTASPNEPAHEPGSGSGQLNINGLRAFETLGRFLEEDGWHPQEIEDKYTYRAYFHGKNGELRCYAQIRVDLEQFIFYAVVTVNVPEEVRPAVAEFITRANYGLRLGNFEMDYADGEVRFKCSLDFEGEALTHNLIRRAIYPAVQTMDKYLPGLMKVAFGARTPVEAIQEIEGN
jgi:hypothetical protein